MPTQRPALYSSAIQHVLVLQEEDDSSPSSQNPPPKDDQTQEAYPWRLREKMKTANGALVLCLNIGVDPPDVTKPTPCARLECWTEPNVESPHVSLQQISTALKSQYEWWQGKAKYKVAQDPTVRDVKQMCLALRKAAKEERVLFHYNGHGVPRPTPNGEIWVFNHNYTQYIPMNLFDLHDVLGSPTLYVFDCNSAGIIYNHFCKMLEQLDREWDDAKRKSDKELPKPAHRNTILLGACAEGEVLPTNAKLPADLFTSCLTTPIKTVLRWFLERTCVMGLTIEQLDSIPGNRNLRQTPLGELYWIFTSVTDAIAWNVLPRDKFKMLYRQDLLLASLMRNFLLAERIMRSYGCTPVSYPAMPETHNHPLWETFDYAMEQILCQLPALMKQQRAMEAEQNVRSGDPSGAGPSSSSEQLALRQAIENTHGYIPSTFFEDQMKAFDVWLMLGPERRHPPQELPIMLQVLLSPNFRIKALPLLSRYLQTGPVAVDLALSVGIFPYVRKLLLSSSKVLQKELVFIWSKILALDSTCKSDLVTDKGEVYFVKFLQPGPPEDEPKPVYLAVALFVLSVVAKDYADRCREVGALEACYLRLSHSSPFVRRWACLCLTVILRHASHPAQVNALEWAELILKLRTMVKDDAFPDVRAAATATLSAIMSGTLKFASPQSDSDSSSFGSKSEYQPNQPRPDTTHQRDADCNPATDSQKSMPEYTGSSQGSIRTSPPSAVDVGATFTSIDDYLDAPVPEYMPYERDALLNIGSAISEIARRESSVLIRREVAIAIDKAVRYQRERFVRAAHITDIIGIDESREPCSDVDKCEAVYRRLWMALSELAFDPHPVIAKLARRNYDSVSDTLLKRTSVIHRFQQSMMPDDISPTDHVFSPQNSSSEVVFDDIADNIPGGRGRSAPRRIGQGCVSNVAAPSPLQQYPLRPAVHSSTGIESMLQRESPRSSSNTKISPPNGRAPSLPTGPNPRRPSGIPTLPPNAATDIGKVPVSTSSIHVRSTSGSFDLNVSSRLPLLSSLPRVNSASLVSDIAGIPSEDDDIGSSASQDITVVDRNRQAENRSTSEDSFARSLPPIVLAKGVGDLLKTVTQKLQIGQDTSSDPQPGSYGSNRSSAESREEQAESTEKPISPPRPPRRSLSYQVLNAATGLSPNGEGHVFASSRSTYFAATGIGAPDENNIKSRRLVPRGYDRLYLSGGGDAALSLQEWSNAYIARVKFDDPFTDCVNEVEPIPRYATLWDRFMKSSGNIPSEGLRAFALLGRNENKMNVGSCGDEEESNNFKNALEISAYAMGAGGGAVTAMEFLPRDIGVGDDQLIATGDSKGSVGVYEIRTGSCQGSFGIPFPPGIPEVGISSILCLNHPDVSDPSRPIADSRSALLLAGAYDGRVAVFKSDLHGPKYRIMSTFQASGQSYWSKVGTSREPLSRPSQHSMMQDSESMESIRPGSTTFANTVRESGNGLVLAFDTESLNLAAAGCDGNIVRIWDLAREKCIWEGPGVDENTWPTAVTMWGRINPHVFVVGSSNGKVNMIDMREGGNVRRGTHIRNFGSRPFEPVISLGTCPPVGIFTGESVVSADIGGEISFWDPRFNASIDSPNLLSYPEERRIKAHRSNLTAMCVHPAGTLIASGSTARCVKVFGPDRTMLRMLSSHQKLHFSSRHKDNRMPPVTSLSFQPHSNLLGIGCMDSSVIIYGQPDIFPGVQEIIS